jgi:hypothetical protein
LCALALFPASYKYIGQPLPEFSSVVSVDCALTVEEKVDRPPKALVNIDFRMERLSAVVRFTLNDFTKDN